MARTVATSRLTASARLTASPRTTVSQFRVPIELLDLGVTHLLSWRGGFANTDPTVVYDDINYDAFTYAGSSGVGSIYTTGEYSVNLTPTNNDTFAGVRAPLHNLSTMSMMGFVNRDVASDTHCLFSQWNANKSEFAILFRSTSGNELEVLTYNGSNSTLATSTSGSFNQTGAWEAWGYSKNGTTGTISRNGTRVTTSGSTVATMNSATADWRIGNFTNAAGALASKMDGKVGLFCLAFGKTWTIAEEQRVYTLLRQLAGY